MDGNGLERAGGFHFGEQVTEFRAGALTSTDIKANVIPTLVFFTANGRIGIISKLEDEYALMLTALQRNLSQVLKGPGGLEHTLWRSPCTPNGLPDGESVGFIDGDFVERFLEFQPDSSQSSRVLDGNNASQRIKEGFEGVTQALEQLQLVH